MVEYRKRQGKGHRRIPEKHVDGYLPGSCVERRIIRLDNTMVSLEKDPGGIRSWYSKNQR